MYDLDMLVRPERLAFLFAYAVWCLDCVPTPCKWGTRVCGPTQDTSQFADTNAQAKTSCIQLVVKRSSQSAVNAFLSTNLRSQIITWPTSLIRPTLKCNVWRASWQRRQLASLAFEMVLSFFSKVSFSKSICMLISAYMRFSHRFQFKHQYSAHANQVDTHLYKVDIGHAVLTARLWGNPPAK